MSTGELSNTTKSYWRSGPLRASASAHLIASRKQCIILTWSTWLIRTLQFLIRGKWFILLQCLLVIQSKTNLAYTSLSKAIIWREQHKDNPSLNAQSSTSTLDATQMLHMNPLIHPPFKSHISPPPLALLGLPKVDPSTFNLNQPSHDLLHWPKSQLRWPSYLPSPHSTCILALHVRHLYTNPD